MIELVFVACLLSPQEFCDERHVLHLPDIGIMDCMMTAQPQMAKWVEAHPNYKITSWKCRWQDLTADARDA